MSTSPPPPRQCLRSRGRLGWSGPGQPQQLPLWLWNWFRRHGFKFLVEVGVGVGVWVGYLSTFSETSRLNILFVIVTKNTLLQLHVGNYKHKYERPTRVQTLIIFWAGGDPKVCAWSRITLVSTGQNQDRELRCLRIMMRHQCTACVDENYHSVTIYWCLNAIAGTFQKLRWLINPDILFLVVCQLLE